MLLSNKSLWLCMPIFSFGLSSYAGEHTNNSGDPIEEIEVIGITPTSNIGLPEEYIPYQVQSASSEDLERTQSLDLTDFMNRSLGSVHVNDAQNNPMQPDVQYRGFTASPLLGLPQGIAIYQNGIRINEPFGDSINWDLLPESSIGTIDLIGGANPLYGLNSLGGALSITTKNGFTHPGHSFESYGGSFERIVTTLESGGNDGTWGYYITANYFDEEGWRDASSTNVLNVFGTLGYRSDDSTLDVNFSRGDTDLIGNGPAPVELLALDREAVFTSPDQTENDLLMFSVNGSHWFSDTIQTSGNIFYRVNNTDTINGDGTEFEECSVAGADVLVEGFEADDFGGAACDDGVAAIAAAIAVGDIAVVEDQFGNNIEAENANGTERNAINNLSSREQKGYGSTLQTTFLNDLFGRENQFIIGAGYQQGLIDFFQATEISTLVCEFNGNDCTQTGADRSTVGTGLFAVEEGTQIKAHNRTWSIFVADTLSITKQLTLTVSARYNNSSIKLGDRSNESNLVDPEDPAALNGEHDYQRINPAVGLTFQFKPSLGVYGGYSESSRAPTPIELLCADPDAPCSLPNAFLADPPLDQVVTESFEGGVRGTLRDAVNFEIGGFHSTNKDDIIFTSTGGIGSNEGFFQNIGKTRRIGTELGLSGTGVLDTLQDLDWSLNYSFVDATFETGFQAASANHPQADAEGEITVQAGDRIPGIPQHTLKVGADYYVTPKLALGGTVLYNSDQYLRGDEANLLDTVEGYTVVNIHGSYQVNQHLSFFARINNLLDNDYETFGLLGEPDEVFPTFSDARFLGPGAPISGFAGIRLVF